MSMMRLSVVTLAAWDRRRFFITADAHRDGGELPI